MSTLANPFRALYSRVIAITLVYVLVNASLLYALPLAPIAG